MQSSLESPWVILLAGGEGTRLRSLTTTKEGVAIPKQFCSLRGESSLLQESLQRASTIAPRQRICAIVAEQHRQWWQPQLWALPPENIIVQPANRGTAHGVLLPLLTVLERDPSAEVVLLPCDHYVANEPVLAESIRSALFHISANDARPILLGMEPERPDPGLGYIVPGRFRTNTVAEVSKFVEKPPCLQARHLINGGALWNAFIVVSCGLALLRLFATPLPDLVSEMQTIVQHTIRAADPAALTDWYRNLPALDFSQHILQEQEADLRVLGVPACGWSDLGTPDRVGATLSRMTHDGCGTASHSTTVHLNLAEQYARLQGSQPNLKI